MNPDVGIAGLRGWASVMVLAYHVGGAMQLPDGNWLFGWGYAGVDLFFVVSGYLLTRKIYDGDYAVRGRFSPTVYYLRRAFRIWPLYWVTLPLFVVTMGYPVTPLDAVFAQDYFRRTFFYAPPWTLCIEEAFYLVVPLWAALYRMRWWPHLTVGLLAVSVAWRFYAVNPTVDLYLMAQFPAYAFSYGMGAVAARGFAVKVPSWAVAGLVGVTLPTLVVTQVSPIEPALAALVAFVVLTNARHARVLVHPVSQFVGRLTYPLYLLAVPIEFALMDTGVSVWIWGPLAVILTVGLSWLAATFFERPLIRLGRRLERRMVNA